MMVLVKQLLPILYTGAQCHIEKIINLDESVRYEIFHAIIAVMVVWGRYDYQ